MSLPIARAGRLSQIFIICLLALVAFTGCRKKTPEQEFQDVQQLLQERQFPLAILKMRELIQNSPDSPVINEVRLTLAEVYIGLGQMDNVPKALEQLEAVYESEGIESNAGMVAHGAITQILLQLGEEEKALAHVAAGVEKAASNPELQTQLRLSQARMQLESQSEEEQAKALEFLGASMIESEDPQFRGAARELLANYFRQRSDYEESNAVYTAYMEKYPEDPVNTQIKLAVALNQKAAGDEEAAKATFDEGAAELEKTIEGELDLNRRTELLSQLATFQERFGDLDAAEATMKRVMAENPRTQLALRTQFSIAEMFAMNQQWERADEVLNRIKQDNAGTDIEQMADQMQQQIVALRSATENPEAAAEESPATEETTTEETATEEAPAEAEATP